MPKVAGASSLQALPATGRRFATQRRVRLDEAGPDGLLRLDALACYLQDVATDDYLDAGFGDDRAWVLRRTLIAVRAAAGFDENLTLVTWCSGLGGRWAERSTQVRGDRGAVVDAAALWVHIDPTSGIPARLDEGFVSLFGPSAGDRRVGARLLHPPAPATYGSGANGQGDPGEATPRTGTWAPRWCDLDVLGHVNNAAYWTAVVEEPAARAIAPPYRAEIEHRAAVGAGLVVDTPVQAPPDGGLTMWFVGPEGLCASAAITPESAPERVSDPANSGTGSGTP